MVAHMRASTSGGRRAMVSSSRSLSLGWGHGTKARSGNEAALIFRRSLAETGIIAAARQRLRSGADGYRFPEDPWLRHLCPRPAALRAHARRGGASAAAEII